MKKRIATKGLLKLVLNAGLILYFMFFQMGEAECQHLSDQTYLISDLTKTELNQQVIASTLNIRWSGVYVKLEARRNNNRLYLISDSGRYAFEDFAKTIKLFLQERPRRILPVFIDFSGSISELNEAFISSGLSDKIFYLPPGERWPETEKILSSGKNLLLFTFQKSTTGNMMFHYAWDYIAEYPHSGDEDPAFDGHYINGDIRKELLMVRDLEIPASIIRPSQLVLDITQNQFYINHLLNRWKNTGKRPNFIFAGSFSSSLAALIPYLGTYKSVKGVVKIDDRPMDKVFWKHSNKCITYSYFSFPYSEGEELNLTPFSPGYSFNPQTYTLSGENVLPNLTFSAQPLSIDEGLTAYFPFDGNWENFLDKNEKSKPVNAEFISDITKGNVAKLADSAYIIMAKPEKYGIRNNSFTVSSWIKLNKVEQNRDYCILGTPEGVFRKGLHLVIRQGRPYFGFYGNDLWAEKTVAPNEWFHIVFRYNFFNGEQAIFVNGSNVGLSYNHASFIGDSALQVGKSIQQRNYLNGYIDNLYIWNRPLGEEEIRFLHNSELKPEIEKKTQIPGIIWFIPEFILLAGIGIFVVNRSRKRKKQLAWNPQRKFKTTPAYKNAIFLFGDFMIYDTKGEELSDKFTPKIRELFLIILLFTIKNKKGIRTDKLTSVLWFGFEPQKAANNRSVTFNKLRKIIESVEGLRIEFNSGFWSVNFDNSFYCDYLEAYSIMERKDTPPKSELEKLFDIVRKGDFLNEIHYDWLDEFKGYVANEIIDNLTSLASRMNENENGQILKEISERILLADDLNEKALQLVIRQLIINNNLNQAKFRFNSFKNNYQTAYGEPYKLSFEEFREYDFS
jgi:two-component SAPR family response regulator